MSDDITPLVKRVGHRKSRLGCFQCKRRKIKCQETKPACENCLQKDFPCQYPPKVTYRIVNPVEKCIDAPNPQEIVQLQATPTTFTMEDMRLFHHFLMCAYPHLPMGNDQTWVQEVPKLAHQHEYLMHSMLALAASHLTLTSSSDLQTTAFAHRVKAVSGLNEALSTQLSRSNDTDAMLATCYALTFQSTYFADGLGDFITMIRGCGIVIRRIWEQRLGTVFKEIDHDGHFRVVMPRLVNLPEINANIRESARESLQAVEPLCTDMVEVFFYEKLTAIINGLVESSLEGYIKFIDLYRSFHFIPQTAFPRFIDPKNNVTQILLAHFIGIQLMVTPIAMREFEHRISNSPASGTLGWLDTICSNVADDMQHYLEWPREVVKVVRLELAGKSTMAQVLRKREGLSPSVV